MNEFRGFADKLYRSNTKNEYADGLMFKAYLAYEDEEKDKFAREIHKHLWDNREQIFNGSMSQKYFVFI